MFQAFVQSVAIRSGLRVKRLMSDKGGEYFDKEFKDYCLQTGMLLEYTSASTPQQVGMSEHVGRNLATMVRYMLAVSGLSKFLRGELMFTAAFQGSRAPHSAIGMQYPNKLLHGMEPDLCFRRVIGARAFVHIDTCTKKLELKAVQERLVGYSNNSKSYRVYNRATRRIMESRNVVFIEMPSHLLPPQSGKYPMELWEYGQVGDDQGHNYITDDAFLRDLRDYTSVLDLLPDALPVITSLRASFQQAYRWLNSWSRSARSQGYAHERASELTQEGALPGEAPLEGVPEKGGFAGRRLARESVASAWGTAAGGRSAEGRYRTAGTDSVAQGTLPGSIAGWIIATLTAHAPLEVTLSVTRSGVAVRSLAERGASHVSNCAHLAPIASEGVLSILRRLGLCPKASLRVHGI